MNKNVIILVNTGTPEKPERKYVHRFLTQFLNDYRVIDLPWLFRKILVNLIIIPFRIHRSTSLYEKLWTPEGSPLLINLDNLVNKLQTNTDSYRIIGAMRYGNPSLDKILKSLKKDSVEKLIIFSLFPHYASSTTGSVNELVMSNIRTWEIIPDLKFINHYYSHPSFIRVWVNQIGKYNLQNFDHVLFSYHGLPLSHIQKSHPEIDFSSCSCTKYMPSHGTSCYKAACYETTRLISQKLNLQEGAFSTSFQSRLTKKWLSPFTDQALSDLLRENKKRVLVVAPSFVADCLETIIEIGDDYKNLFKQSGGEELILVESLNDNDEWVKAIKEIAGLEVTT